MPLTSTRKNRGRAFRSSETGVAGEDTSSRLAARTSRPGLGKRTLSGGAEVYEGPLATQALGVLGARAMTVDSNIVVGEDFDPGRTESAALLAHEQVHQAGSGGKGSNEIRDAEEIAARSAEAMVVHRATAEGGDGTTAPQAAAGDDAQATGQGAQPEEEEQEPSAERGYAALAAQGLGHDEIVERLVREVIEQLDDGGSSDRDRQNGGGF
jgi:hypothetical protein